MKRTQRYLRNGTQNFRAVSTLAEQTQLKHALFVNLRNLHDFMGLKLTFNV